jgi:hypothetical protein
MKPKRFPSLHGELCNMRADIQMRLCTLDAVLVDLRNEMRAALERMEKRLAQRTAAEDFFFVSILPSALGVYVLHKMNRKTGRAMR